MVVQNADPSFIAQTYHSTGYAGNFGYNNPELDNILDTAMEELDPEQMAARITEAGELLEDDLPGLLSVYQASFVGLKDYISGYQYHPMYQLPLLYEIEKGN